jgi:hypothetical protein
MIGYMYTNWEHTALELPMHKAEVLHSTPQAQLLAEASSPLSERKEVATYAPARESVWIPLLLAAANGAIKCCSAAHKACREGGVQQAAPGSTSALLQQTYGSPPLQGRQDWQTGANPSTSAILDIGAKGLQGWGAESSHGPTRRTHGETQAVQKDTNTSHPFCDHACGSLRRTSLHK